MNFMGKVYTSWLGLLVFVYFVFLLVLNLAILTFRNRHVSVFEFSAYIGVPLIFLIPILYSYFSWHGNILLRKILFTFVAGGISLYWFNLAYERLQVVQKFGDSYGVGGQIQAFQENLMIAALISLFVILMWIPKINLYVDGLVRIIMVFLAPFIYSFLALYIPFAN